MERFFVRNAVYQVYPRSFCDSNGDGIGDIQGIISKLDYIQSLGANIVWLSPVYASPLFDMGYDVSDYYSIHPDLGTMEDFDRLLEEATKRGMKIVMDLVVNHTSSEHRWFKESLKKDSPYHDFYIYKKGKGKNPPNNWVSMFGGPAWEYVPELDEWYLHLYDKKQPDLNWRNPKVYEEVKKILEFYLDKGVYGFRCDVINQIYKDSFEDGHGNSFSGRGIEHYLCKDGHYEILRSFREEVFAPRGDTVMIGETFNVSVEQGKRYLEEGSLDMFFQFETMAADKRLGGGLKRKFKPRNLIAPMYKFQENIDWNANYFENHDQHRCVSRFGDEGEYYQRSARALALLLLGLRGTPFIYQGQELGMLTAPAQDPSESRDCSVWSIHTLTKRVHLPKKIGNFICSCIDRDRCRNPILWSDPRTVPFEFKAFPVDLRHPEINAEEEVNDPNSLYHFYQSILDYRKKSDVLCLGSFEAIPANKDLAAFVREYEGKRIVVLVNLSRKTMQIPSYFKEKKFSILFSSLEKEEQNLNSLPPYSAYWLSEE